MAETLEDRIRERAYHIWEPTADRQAEMKNSGTERARDDGYPCPILGAGPGSAKAVKRSDRRSAPGRRQRSIVGAVPKRFSGSGRRQPRRGQRHRIVLNDQQPWAAG
jgi:Protein of unknown function (DUF2934)